MPIQIEIWKITNNIVDKINIISIDSESGLEDILAKDISILGENYILIGR